MQESLVKVVLVFTALASVVVGVVFLVIPGWYFEALGLVSVVDLGWIRSIGASVLGLQGFGLLIASVRRRDTNPLVGIVALVTTIQAGTIWYSLFAKEFGEMNRWGVIAPAILATIAAVLMWLAWLSRRRSVGTLPPKKQRSQATQRKSGPVENEEAQLSELEEPNPPPQELVDRIDAESPRLRE